MLSLTPLHGETILSLETKGRKRAVERGFVRTPIGWTEARKMTNLNLFLKHTISHKIDVNFYMFSSQM